MRTINKNIGDPKPRRPRKTTDEKRKYTRKADQSESTPYSEQNSKEISRSKSSKPFEKKDRPEKREFKKSSYKDSFENKKSNRSFDDSKPDFKRTGREDKKSFTSDKSKGWHAKTDEKSSYKRKSSDSKDYEKSSNFDKPYKGKRSFDDSKPAFKKNDRNEKKPFPDKVKKIWLDKKEDKPFDRKEVGEEREHRKSSKSSFSEYRSNNRDRGYKREDKDDRKSGFQEIKRDWKDNKDEKKPYSRDGKKEWRGTDERKPLSQDKRSERKEFFASKNYQKTESPLYKNKRKSYGEGKPEKREGIRLNKYIATAGICSRRDADELIASGAVKINGVVVTEMGIRVLPTDSVQYGGETLKKERPVYVLLNKPKGFITTTDDPEKRKTVMELIRNACKESLYPVGRLDRNTTGLLLLTNDGDLTKKLTHPSHGVRKIYHIELDKPLTQEDYQKIQDGVELEDGPIKVDEIAYIAGGKSKRELGIEIHSGRNRIVRRIFEQLEYNVNKLDRVYFAGLTKKDLPRGKWRFLSIQEVNLLKMLG